MYFVLNRERSNTKSANGSVLNRSRFNTKALLYYIQYTVHWEVHEDDAMALPLDMGPLPAIQRNGFLYCSREPKSMHKRAQKHRFIGPSENHTSIEIILTPQT